jgi:hypothetical protein
MKNTVKMGLGLCASAIALSFAVGAQAQQAAFPGALDGSYNQLEQLLEELPAFEAEILEEIADLDNAAKAAAESSAAVQAALSDDDKELLAEFAEASAASDAADAAKVAADEAVVSANEARDAALAERTVAQSSLQTAGTEFQTADTAATNAKAAADTAQAAYTAKLADVNATPGDIATALATRNEKDALLSAANAVKAEKAAALATAEGAVVTADASFAAATTAATAASTAATTAATAATTAISTKTTAGTELQASLDANEDLAAVFEDLEIDVAAAGGSISAIANVNDAVVSSATSLAEAQAAVEALNLPALLAGAQRIDTILTDAANSSQENIANASRALTEDPLDPENPDLLAFAVNYETEVLAALTDHEDRITDNAAAIVAEAAARVAGDAATLTSANTFTTTAVAAEAALRVAGDVALGNRITAEETARIAADTALGSRITGETNARIASDNAINTRITQVDKALRDKIATSTATAIAMGGATILPDTNFTLAGNVGVYEGATALAINAAGRVSEKAYVTAAVGGGTNKGGKLGARVGVVFGF